MVLLACNCQNPLRLDCDYQLNLTVAPALSAAIAADKLLFINVTEGAAADLYTV